MIERPTLVHFLAIQTNDYIHIKCLISLKKIQPHDQHFGLVPHLGSGLEKDTKNHQSPIQALKLLSRDSFQVKVVGLNSEKNPTLEKVIESDSYGAINIRINTKNQDIQSLQVFEESFQPGVELLLGNFIPLTIKDPKKVIICDFDKTLVDTKYSTTKEVYTSLTRPIHYFPTVTESVEILKNYIKHGYHPFILSASPHFYEGAMRDWLYKNSIYTAGIFLKDYRQIFSILEESLTPKDLKIQGLYKLNHLLDILMMTEIPSELVLMGDNFESDPVIYLCLAKFLHNEMDPWKFCHFLNGHEAFKMNKKQMTRLLNKLYKLSGDLKKAQSKGMQPLIKIFIRKKVSEDQIDIPSELESKRKLVKLYQALPSEVALYPP